MECGSMLRPGDTRCRNCGASVTDVVHRCPECGKSVPAKSVFCPCCGKMVWNDMAEQPVPSSQDGNPDYDLPESAAGGITDDTSAINVTRDRRRGMRNRIITIVLVVVVLCFAGYAIYDWGGGGGASSNPYKELTGIDTAATPEPERMNIVEASGIYGNTMVHDNRIGDKSTFGAAAYTLRNGVPLIVGINYFSDEKQRSFFKLTQLHKINGAWRCGEETLRYDDMGLLVMERDMLKLSGENIPRFEIIDGKTYFYFVYLVKPRQSVLASVDKCNLKLSLFNVESTDIIQLDYECEPVVSGGSTLYYGEVVNPRETPEFEFLSGELSRLPIVYRPSAEEIEMASPGNASRRWQADNDSLVGQLRSGRQEVTFSMLHYGSPLFSRGDVDMDSKVSTETYVFYVTHSGTVFGCNMITKKFFIAYVDARGAVPQIEINSNGTLHVIASGLDFDFDPATGRAMLN